MAKKPAWEYYGHHPNYEIADGNSEEEICFMSLLCHIDIFPEDRDHLNCNRRRHNELNITMNGSTCNSMSGERFFIKEADGIAEDILKKSILASARENLQFELQSNVELLESSLEMIEGELDEIVTNCAEKIADILFKAEWELYDIICLQYAELTRAFLRKRDSMAKEMEERGERREKILVRKIYGNSRTDEALRIDYGDSRSVVDRVMSFLDVRHLDVLLKYGPDKDFRKRHFLRNVVSMARQNQKNLKAIKLFVDQIIEWNILDEATSRFIEQSVFFKADKQVIQIIMQSGLHNHIAKLFGRNLLAAVFGNRNIKIGFFKRKKKFNVNVCGYNGLSALHYATKNRNLKKMKYLLDHGVEPNSETLKRTTALSLILHKPGVNPIESEKCAELLLQYGADLYLFSSDWMMFDCCMVWTSWRTELDKAYESVGHLSKLVLAYMCIHEADGMRDISFRLSTTTSVDNEVCESDNLFNFYNKCHQELRTLKDHQIRGNLTMFTILCETGRKLIRLLNNGDCQIINDFMDKYRNEMTLNRYYLNALREHMRQVKKLMAHKNRAMSVISMSIKTLAPYSLVLGKIVSYLTYEDLLPFQ